MILLGKLLKCFDRQIGHLAILESVVRHIGTLIDGSTDIGLTSLVAPTATFIALVFLLSLFVSYHEIRVGLTRFLCSWDGIGLGICTVSLVAIRFTLDIRLAHERNRFRQRVDRCLRNLPRNRPRRLVIQMTVKNLAHALHEISILLEGLSDRNYIRKCCTEMGDQIRYFGCVRPHSCHHAGA